MAAFTVTPPIWLVSLTVVYAIIQSKRDFIEENHLVQHDKQVIGVQSNLDYPHSLGLDEIIQIIQDPDIENMNINEEQNWLNQEATFIHKKTLLQIVWKTI